MHERLSTTVSRRRLLGGILAGGAAASVLPLAKAQASVAARPVAATTPSASTFFADAGINFQALFALGAAGYGASEVGEVLAIFDRIHARGDGYGDVYAEFLAAGLLLREQGDEARRRGLRETAFARYLRSAMYLDQALFFVLGSDQPTRANEGRVYGEMERSWSLAAGLWRKPFKRVRIPYGDGALPGWLLLADGAGSRSRRPTIILNNGSDAQNVDMWVYGGAAALERGWNALIFEGPGQGSNLFLRDVAFRPDWEAVITPVVDFLRGRLEVDRRRIALAGQSFGGYLVLRAAAHEHRLAAVVADPGVVDVFVSWRKGLPPPLIEMLDAGDRSGFDALWSEIETSLSAESRFGIAKRIEIYGDGSFYDQLSLAREFVLSREQVRRISSPTAVLSPEGEQFFPGQPETAYDWLDVPKELLRFTAAEGAQFHCEPMAPQRRNERVFDWLEKNLEPTS